jgi:hypothetical protein
MLNIFDEHSKFIRMQDNYYLGMKQYDHDSHKSSIEALDSQGEEQEELKRKRKSKE